MLNFIVHELFVTFISIFFFTQAILFSKWLLQNDVKKGDVVMVAGVSNLDYLPALLGAVSVGCICQTVGARVFL